MSTAARKGVEETRNQLPKLIEAAEVLTGPLQAGDEELAQRYRAVTIDFPIGVGPGRRHA